MRTTPQRSALMRRVRRRDTAPEMLVRQVLHGLGARYRIHVSDLPGSPDIANKGRRVAIFVHGCFWHHHDGCPRAAIPERNREFWRPKLLGNRERDLRKVEELERNGFAVMTIWECELSCESLEERLSSFWFDEEGTE